MRLSERLRMVASMVPPTKTVADIGCDHAYLSVWLLREGIAGFAYACDVREGPLAKAAETIRFFHMQERAKTVLCDGLAGLSAGDAETIVMAGMGGELMTRLLTEGEACVRAAKCLVLQPQSDREMVRRAVAAAGFVITDEQCVVEDGKFYLCMAAVPKEAAPKAAAKAYAPWEYRYGRWLVRRKDETYLTHLTEECEKKITMLTGLAKAGTPLAQERVDSAAMELKEIVGVMKLFFPKERRKEK